MSRASSLLYDGFEFEEKEVMIKYITFKRRFNVCSLLSVVMMVPALILFFSSYLLTTGSSPSYVYLAPLAISVPFSVLSFRANSRLTEIVNSDEVRHAG